MIILFNPITAIVLPIFEIQLTNLYLILKSLVFISIRQLDDDKYLP